MRILGTAVFALGLLVFQRAGKSLRTDALVRAEYERNPLPYYAVRLCALGMIIGGMTILWRAQ